MAKVERKSCPKADIPESVASGLRPIRCGLPHEGWNDAARK